MADLDFLIELQEKMSGPATRAAQALSKLESEIGKEKTALAGLEAKLAETAKKMDLLNQGGSVSVGAMRKLQQQHTDLSTAIGQSHHSIGALTDKLGPLQSQAQSTSLPMEFLSDKLAAMGGPAGIAVGAITAVATAMAAATLATAHFALEQANGKRSMLINLEAITGSHAAMETLMGTIDGMKASSPLAASRIEDLGKALAVAGLNAGDTRKTLKSLSDVESTVGAGAADALLGAIQKSATEGHFAVSSKQLKETGIQLPQLYANIAEKMGVGTDQVEKLLADGKVSMDVGLEALNETIGQKFGKLSAEKMIDLDVQTQKLKDHLGDLFEDIDVKPFLESLHGVLGVLDSNTESGAKLKEMMNGIFQGFGDDAAKQGPKVQALLEGMVDEASKFYKMIDTISSAWSKLFGDDKASEGTLAAFRALGQAIVFLVGAITLLGAVAAYPFVIIGEAIGNVISAIADLAHWFYEAGGNAIQGFIDGFLAGVVKACDAVSGAGGEIAGAFAASHEQASPSKLFARMAHYDVMGYAQQFEKSAPIANDVVSKVGIPQQGVAPRFSAAAAAPTAHGAISIALHITGATDPKEVGAQAQAGVKRALAEAGYAA